MSRDMGTGRMADRSAKHLFMMAIMMIALAQGAFAQSGSTPSTATNTVKVVLIADQGWIDAVVDAAKEAGMSGTPTKIPISVLKKVALNYLFGRFGAWLQQAQICRCFDQWMAGKNVGATGTITVEFVLVASADEVPGAETPSIAVEMFASKTGQGTATAGNSGGRGYLAPVKPGVGPVTRYDIFGDGSYVISVLECPRVRLR